MCVEHQYILADSVSPGYLNLARRWRKREKEVQAYGFPANLDRQRRLPSVDLGVDFAVVDASHDAADSYRRHEYQPTGRSGGGGASR